MLTRMVQHSADDLMVLLASSVAGEPRERRKVERALGAWRGSTISGYLRGDEQSYLENFRCSKQTFAAVVALLEDTPLDRKAVRASASTDWRKTRRMIKPGEALDPPSRRYKVAAHACMPWGKEGQSNRSPMLVPSVRAPSGSTWSSLRMV